MYQSNMIISDTAQPMTMSALDELAAILSLVDALICYVDVDH